MVHKWIVTESNAATSVSSSGKLQILRYQTTYSLCATRNDEMMSLEQMMIHTCNMYASIMVTRSIFQYIMTGAEVTRILVVR
jgi:hypothetical protein